MTSAIRLRRAWREGLAQLAKSLAGFEEELRAELWWEWEAFGVVPVKKEVTRGLASPSDAHEDFHGPPGPGSDGPDAARSNSGHFHAKLHDGDDEGGRPLQPSLGTYLWVPAGLHSCGVAGSHGKRGKH